MPTAMMLATPVLKRSTPVEVCDDPSASKKRKPEPAAAASPNDEENLYRTPIFVTAECGGDRYPCHLELLRYACTACVDDGVMSDGTGTAPRSLMLRLIDSRSLSIFLVWLYTGKLLVLEEAPQLPPRGNDDPDDPTVVYSAKVEIDMVRLFAFAERYAVKKLQKRTAAWFAFMMVNHGQKASKQATEEAYASLPDFLDDPCKSLLHDVLIDQAQADLTNSALRRMLLDCCVEFQDDIAEATIPLLERGKAKSRKRLTELAETNEFKEYVLEEKECATAERIWHLPYRSAGMLVLFDNFVVILVGPEKAVFHVHKALLCRYSTYFEAALLGSFAESERRTLDLDNEDERIFRGFLEWLYTGELSVPPSSTSTPLSLTMTRKRNARRPGPSSGSREKPYQYYARQEASSNVSLEQLFEDLIDLYIFADRRHVQWLRNDIATQLIYELEDMHSPSGAPISVASMCSLIHRAAEELDVRSSLISILITEIACSWNGSAMQLNCVTGLPREILLNALRVCTHLRDFCDEHVDGYVPWYFDLCDFHDHPWGATEGDWEACQEVYKEFREWLAKVSGWREPNCVADDWMKLITAHAT